MSKNELADESTRGELIDTHKKVLQRLPLGNLEMG